MNARKLQALIREYLRMIWVYAPMFWIAVQNGSSIEDMNRKPLLQRLMQEKIFERYIVLYKKDCAGQIKAIYDERGTGLYDASRKQGILC